MQRQRSLVKLYVCVFRAVPRGVERTVSCYSCTPNLIWSDFSQQTRTFRTRSHAIGSIGLGKDNAFNVGSGGESDSSAQRKFVLFKSKKDGDKFKEPVEAEKIKLILNDTNVKDEDKQRIKIAFAEGYFTAYGKSRVSPKARLLQILRDAMATTLILIILFSLIGDLSGGSFRRVLIGNRNEVHPEEIDVTFEDVRGVDEAKQELQEIVEFLKDPEKFSRLGGKLPKGVLLVGPPGTGKTLLARAVAGEAGVPFFHVAGPEFDEILVGQGARRVRDLFSTAKQRAPCVIFIDEIDSVGAKRTNSVLHPYANQTINQLLTEMDGFRQNEGVIVLGATNRREDLDKALLRPGRFDVEVQVPVPDLSGRTDIFDLYLNKITLAETLDLQVLARRTTGFTGADIENMCNQAALRAAIEDQKGVYMRHLENARDKVIMGPERKKRIPDEQANLITAYHEAGHALVAYFTKDSTPLHKVTIVSRGPSLGHTAYIPEKDDYHVTKSQMLATLDSAMGGRVAEELIFGEDKVTSGASSDLKSATQIASLMVKNYGMSSRVGVRTFEKKRELVSGNELSDSTIEAIDGEIKRILQVSYITNLFF
jgi:ATP-dependent metalloprotease